MNHEQMAKDDTSESDELTPREACPDCGGTVEVASADPLEEYGIEPGCDYYRAEVAGGGVVRE